MARHIDTAEVAKLIRKALSGAFSASFPDTRFSVKISRYSGGSSVRVRWTDGPTTAMVEAIAKRFQGSSFDGMVDLKSYHDSELDGERVHFGADHVFCERAFSVGLAQRAADAICRRYGLPRLKVGEYAWGGADLSAARGVSVKGSGDWRNPDLSDLIYRDLYRRACVRAEARS